MLRIFGVGNLRSKMLLGINTKYSNHQIFDYILQTTIDTQFLCIFLNNTLDSKFNFFHELIGMIIKLTIHITYENKNLFYC